MTRYCTKASIFHSYTDHEPIVDYCDKCKIKQLLIVRCEWPKTKKLNAICECCRAIIKSEKDKKYDKDEMESLVESICQKYE